MEGLRIVLLPELLDLFRGHLGLAERVKPLAYIKIFEVKLLWHFVSCFIRCSVCSLSSWGRCRSRGLICGRAIRHRPYGPAAGRGCIWGCRDLRQVRA